MTIKSKIIQASRLLTDELRLKGYESLYPFYKNQLAPPKAHWQYSLNAKQIYNSPRQNGVSGYYRLYNEEDFLQASVLSHLPFFDELILVYNSTCTDKTPQIAQALAKKYPAKIKAFVYEPQAFQIKTKEYKILPAKHPNSFANYYNFALSKTTKNIVAKVDGDHIAIDTAFAKIAKNSSDMDFMQNTYYHFSGINLWRIDGEICVDPAHIPGINGDHGFVIIKPQKRYYIKTLHYESASLLFKNLQHKNAGILFFHLKNMRSYIPYHSSRGLTDEIHQAKYKKLSSNVQKRSVDWQTFITKYRDYWLQKTGTDIAQLPDPNDYLSLNKL